MEIAVKTPRKDKNGIHYHETIDVDFIDHDFISIKGLKEPKTLRTLHNVLASFMSDDIPMRQKNKLRDIMNQLMCYALDYGANAKVYLSK
jgi:hypothetical protein